MDYFFRILLIFPKFAKNTQANSEVHHRLLFENKFIQKITINLIHEIILRENWEKRQTCSFKKNYFNYILITFYCYMSKCKCNMTN